MADANVDTSQSSAYGISATGNSSSPNLNLTPEERRVFGQLFRQADTENIGVVTGEAAVKFFEKTRLEPRILGEIWQIADKENRGLLTPAGFGIVLRLIGHYQATGRDPTPELAFRPGPLPKFEGGLPGDPIVQPPPGPPPGALQPQTSGSNLIRVPPLTPDKVTQYAALFDKSGAQNGVLPGEQAKQIFERAGLPNEILGRIWNLADTEQRGALVVTEFIIAMHLLASFKTGQLRALPNVLPAGLYEAAARRPPSRQMSASSPGPVPAIPKQFSGQYTGGSAVRTGSPLSRPAYATVSIAAQGTGQMNDWAIGPADKARFDSIYVTLDKSNRGFITGDEAVPFFSNSKLPEEVLAQIWDLADINSQGQLTRDEFAVAMYLIRQQRGKRDGRDTLPTSLPPNLVPPSMRNQIRPPAQPTAPAFETPAQQLPKSAADDLFGLDALSTPPRVASTQAPLSTGGSAGFGDPFSNARAPGSPTGGSPMQSSGFKPFVPSSSFGQALNFTGTSSGSGHSVQTPKSSQFSNTMDDLLGDNDPEISKKLTSETTELANLSNQVGTLSKQMQEVQGHRSNTQNELHQATTQKREFEARLAQLRTLYEQEAKDVQGLEERLTTSRNETKKLQQEIAMLEGAYQDLQNQNRQVSASLQADQQENASLKEKIRVLNNEITQLKPQLEKLRFEARQQKGLVAINKKQLLTNEGERDKLKTEADELTKSNEENAKIFAANAQVQSPAAVVSPTLSTMSANNPFFRRQGSSVETPGSSYSQSPEPIRQSERSFENVFGPSFEATSAHTPPMPTTSFRQDSPSLERATSPAVSASNGSARDFSGTSDPSSTSEPRQTTSPFPSFGAPQDNEPVALSRQFSGPTSAFSDDFSTDAPKNQGGSQTGVAPPPVSGEVASTTSFTVDRNATTSPAASEARSATSGREHIPGTFPADPNSHLPPTPSGGSVLSERALSISSNDPFAVNKEQVKSPAESKDAFEAAFAGFGGPAKSQTSLAKSDSSAEGSTFTASRFNQEFPPLEEVGADDESDSASERGFEDDFTAASPAHSRNPSTTQDQFAPVPTGSTTATEKLEPGTFLALRPAVLSDSASAASVGVSPPTPDAQSSPPTYDKTISPQQRAHAEAAEFDGLIPRREDPMSSPSSPESTFKLPAQSSGQSIFSAAAPPTQPQPPAKTAFDGFDDEFDDLEDAKEGDVDDDFANLSVHDRSGLDDFNPMFDGQGPQSGHGNGPFGSVSNGFGDFTQSPVVTSHNQTSTIPPTNDNHDWDAIFAGLDSPSNTAPAVEPEAKAEISSEVKPYGNGTAAATKERPQLGRALTEAGEHDDPILKNLTGMGYPRLKALEALEKYDYNLERAADYLARES